MAASTRLYRFSDWTPLKPFCQSGSLSGRRPFYAGSNVESRMSAVREAINYIRLHWEQYPTFMASLRNLMQRSRERVGDEGLTPRAETLLSSVKEWSDRQQATSLDEYSAIRLYTSAIGYNQMFKTINNAFRQEDYTNQVDALRAGVFLIELLNIDLFNYSHANSHANGFEGTVYRGMCVSAEELEDFLAASRAPIQERYLAIPLAMTSASTDRDKALTFALEEATRRINGFPILWEIHVAGLDPKLLKLYQDRFPNSVVTSICAVPIEQLSDYPDENEVLLRGPFFQLLRLRKESLRAANIPLHIIEVVMITANRDHISSVFFSEVDGHRARELFRALVEMQRANLCASRADQYGLSADARAYRESSSRHQRLLDHFVC